jgi:hypothetical protein
MAKRTRSPAPLGRTLERLFFDMADEPLVNRLRVLAKTENGRDSLARVTGITDPQVLHKLAQLQLSSALAASLPILPLAEVAWADGDLDEKERKAVLAAATRCGVPEGSLAYALLEQWLARRPPREMVEAWARFMRGLCELLDNNDKRVLREAVMTRVRSIAEASGGFLGLTSGVSRAEAETLAAFEAVFS